VKAAIAAAAETINRYPDNGCVELREHLAKHLSGRLSRRSTSRSAVVR
jgi:histidinol-phosphate/aromatic aminotransferase/cobyric acid decarboxylase-like protein